MVAMSVPAARHPKGPIRPRTNASDRLNFAIVGASSYVYLGVLSTSFM